MTHSNEALLQAHRRELEIQAHLNVARGIGIERAREVTAATRNKEAFIEDLMLTNAGAHGYLALAARLKGEAIELERGEETAIAMLYTVKRIMATEDRRSKLPSYGARYKLFKSPSGKDSSDAAALVAEVLGLEEEEGIRSKRKFRGDRVEEKAFISPWHIDYEYEGKLTRAMDNFLINKKVAEKTAKPMIKQAIENYDPEEIDYYLKGPKPLWTYEMAARNGTLEDLIAHNGLLKAIEEKAYRDSTSTTAKTVRLVERRTIDKRTHNLKEQQYFLEIGVEVPEIQEP